MARMFIRLCVYLFICCERMHMEIDFFPLFRGKYGCTRICASVRTYILVRVSPRKKRTRRVTCTGLAFAVHSLRRFFFYASRTARKFSTADSSMAPPRERERELSLSWRYSRFLINCNLSSLSNPGVYDKPAFFGDSELTESLFIFLRIAGLLLFVLALFRYFRCIRVRYVTLVIISFVSKTLLLSTAMTLSCDRK